MTAKTKGTVRRILSTVSDGEQQANAIWRTLSLSSCVACAYCLLPVACCLLCAAEPCQSGPQCGQRPGPYAFLIATGPKRGQSHCYICETADRPAVIIFARTPNDVLGKFLAKLDQALASHKAANPNAWVTFLGEDQPALEPKLVEWSRKHGLANIPVGVFEDNDGPPSYRLSRDADVTVLLAVNQKVVVNFALRAGELTEEKQKEIVEALPRILAEKR